MCIGIMFTMLRSWLLSVNVLLGHVYKRLMTFLCITAYWLYFSFKKGKQTRATGVNGYVNISDQLASIKSELTGFSGQNVFRTCKWTHCLLADNCLGLYFLSFFTAVQCIQIVAYQNFQLSAIGLRIQGLQWILKNFNKNFFQKIFAKKKWSSDRANEVLFSLQNF